MSYWKFTLKKGLALALSVALISSAAESFPLRVSAVEASQETKMGNLEDVSQNDVEITNVTSTSLTQGVISNIDYVTEYTYNASAITAPTESNFQKNNAAAPLSFHWYEGDLTAAGAELGTPLESEPVNAGTYTLMVTMEADGSYTAAELRLKIQIAKADLPEIVFGSSSFSNIPYNGKPRKVTLNVKSDLVGVGELTVYYRKEGSSEWTTEEPVNAGTYEYGGMIAEGSNYKAMDEVELCFKMTIQPRTLDDTTFKIKETYYFTNSNIVPKFSATYNLVENVDYKVELVNNKKVHNGTDENPPTAIITAISDNCTGTVTRTFPIEYYPTPNEVLYNGETADFDKWYTKAVEVTAPGFQISDEGADGPYTDSKLYDGFLFAQKKLTFKQNDTGYITDGVLYCINLDEEIPSFTGSESGIKISDNSTWWQTLSQNITYTRYNAQEVNINGYDSITGPEHGYYYLDTSGSTTTLTKEQLDEKVKEGSFIELKNNSFGGSVYFKGLLKLDTDGKYVIYTYIEDGAGNRSDYICSDGIIIDTKAPELVQNTPTGSNLKDVSAEIEVTVSESGSYYYVLSDTEKSITSLAELQACKDTTGCTYGEMIISEEQAGVQSEVALTGLTAATQYYLYAVAEDSVGNVSEVKKLSFVTRQELLQVTPPTLTGIYGQSIEEMTLSGGSAAVPGQWQIVDSDKTDIPDAGTTEKEYDIAFVPTDSVTYRTVYVAVNAEVAPKSLADGVGITVSQVSGDYTYSGTAIKPAVVVTQDTALKGISIYDTEAKLTESDFKVEYCNNMNAYALASNIWGFDAVKVPTVKITGQGNYTGTVSRYFVINKADARYAVDTIQRSLYPQGGSDEINLAELFPADFGEIQYHIVDSSVTGSVSFVEEPTIMDDSLCFELGAGEVGDTADITVRAVTANYQDITITVQARLVEKKLVELQEGASVHIQGAGLIYGQTISELEFDSAIFVEQGTDIVVNGALSWKEPNVAPEAGSAMAGWVFTPFNEEYQSLEGSAVISVAKATPYVAVVPEASGITEGENLGASALTGGRVVYGDGLGEAGRETVVEGSFVWESEEIIPGVTDSGVTDYIVLFIPEDADNYNIVEAICTVMVNEVEEPEVPETPVIPEEPEAPETPVIPEEPEVPESPGIPEEPEIPENPVIPEVPESSTIPEQPEESAEAVASWREPFIIENNSIQGWVMIGAAASEAAVGESLVIDMNGNTRVPGWIIDSIRGRDISLVFAMGNRTTWTVNGQSVTVDNVSDIDFGIETESNVMPQNIIDRLAGERSARQISLAHNGSFGFTAVLAINVGEVYGGQYSNFYYYNPTTEGVEFVEAREITQDGMAQCTFTHASDYVIVIDQTPMVDNNAKSPKTGDTTMSYENSRNPVWLLTIGIFLIVAGLGATLKIIKKE